jgi:hypothetical protein
VVDDFARTPPRSFIYYYAVSVGVKAGIVAGRDRSRLRNTTTVGPRTEGKIEAVSNNVQVHTRKRQQAAGAHQAQHPPKRVTANGSGN